MRYIRIWLVLLAAFALSPSVRAQALEAPEALPDSPVPATAQPACSNGSTQSLEPNDAATSNAVPDSQPPDQENHKRILGMKPQYFVVDDASKARPLTVHEKWRLYYRQTVDPFHFVSTGVSAGIGQARDSFHDYGQGMQGYGKRYGAGFADSSLGGFFGNFLLPSLFHDDPRYFRRGAGSGSVFRRGIYAATRVLITRHDDGSPRPNYPGLMGAFIGTGFGNLYYPESERGPGITFVRGAEVISGMASGYAFQEFWPDIRDKIFKKKKKKDDDLP